MTQEIDGDKAGKSNDSLYKKLLLLFIFAFVAPLIGPLIILTIGVIKGRRQSKYRVLIRDSIIFLIMHCAIIYLVLIPNYKAARFKTKIGKLKSNAHSIQIAVERYSVDNCVYPKDPHQIDNEDYLGKLKLINPFTMQEMKLVQYKPDNTHSAIGYIPIIHNNYAFTFFIVGFGPEGYLGHDYDNNGEPDPIIIVLQSSCDYVYNPKCEEFYRIKSVWGPTPPFKEAIKELKWVWK